MKKIKTRTKLVGAVAALTVAVALSAGTTFAWFTSSTQVSVNTISATVETGTGDLQIASGLNQSTETNAVWTSSLTVDSTTYSDLTLSDLSAVQDSSTGVVKLYNAEEYAKETASTGSGTVTSSNSASSYLEFNFTIRAKEAYTISLVLGSSSVKKNDSTSASTSITAWQDMNLNALYGYGANTTTNKGDAITAEAQNAARVAFETNTYDASSTTMSSGKVWCPNEGEYSGAETTNNTTGNGAGYYKGNLAADYALAIGEIASDYSQKGYDKNVNATDSSIATLVSSGSAGYYYANVTVKLWLEGTDGDCFNSIMNETLDLTIILGAV